MSVLKRYAPAIGTCQAVGSRVGNRPAMLGRHVWIGDIGKRPFFELRFPIPDHLTERGVHLQEAITLSGPRFFWFFSKLFGYARTRRSARALRQPQDRNRRLYQVQPQMVDRLGNRLLHPARWLNRARGMRGSKGFPATHSQHCRSSLLACGNWYGSRYVAQNWQSISWTRSTISSLPSIRIWS